MAFRDIETKYRWSLIISAAQALATLGMFVVALIGVWKVAPIITYQTYQIEQKQEAEQTAELAKVSEAKLPQYSAAVDRFVNDVLGWWTSQVKSYQRIMDLIKEKDKRQLNIKFKVVGSAPASNEQIPDPDSLVVTATGANMKKQTIRVPVNEHAMTPNQYIQCKINQGMLYGLESTARQRVEIAIAQYIQAGMVHKVPPAYVQPDMSLQQLYEAISYHQNQRVEAIAQIRALQGVIEAALDEGD